MLRPAAALAGLAVLTVMFGMPSAALAQTHVPCALENEFCRVPYPTQVIYGIEGRSVARFVGGRGIRCSNEMFGDPAPGILKGCAYVARGYAPPYREGGRDWRSRGYAPPYERDLVRGWRFCAHEGGFCDFRGSRRVRYGAGGRFAEGVFRNGVRCNNRTFGDPAYGVPKSCQVLD